MTNQRRLVCFDDRSSKHTNPTTVTTWGHSRQGAVFLARIFSSGYTLCNGYYFLLRESWTILNLGANYILLEIRSWKYSFSHFTQLKNICSWYPKCNASLDLCSTSLDVQTTYRSIVGIICIHQLYSSIYSYWRSTLLKDLRNRYLLSMCDEYMRLGVQFYRTLTLLSWRLRLAELNNGLETVLVVQVYKIRANLCSFFRTV